MELDLHNHTNHSFDCSMNPAKVVRIAKARGLDAIAITDHNRIEGAYEARRAAGGDIQVIIGEELDTRAGDILGLFITELIEEEDPILAIKAIHDQGGVAVLPHPFTKSMSVQEEVAKALDACEGFNARHARIKSVDGGLGESQIVSFAHSYGLSLTAGSDAHFYRDIGRARTIVPGNSLEDAKQAILMGNTILRGRRSSPFNYLASMSIQVMKRMVHPEPDESR